MKNRIPQTQPDKYFPLMEKAKAMKEARERELEMDYFGLRVASFQDFPFSGNKGKLMLLVNEAVERQDPRLPLDGKEGFVAVYENDFNSKLENLGEMIRKLEENSLYRRAHSTKASRLGWFKMQYSEMQRLKREAELYLNQDLNHEIGAID